MRYINFVVLCICLTCFLSIPVHAVETGSIIHYSEQEVKLNDKIDLEQGYSFVVRDINSNSGDLWLDLYLNGDKLDSDNFVKESSALEYIKTIYVEDDDGDDVEEEHLVIRVSSFGDVDGSGSGMTSRIKIEQFDDGEVDKDDYVLFDRSLTVDVDSYYSLGAGYSIEFSDMDDESILLKFSKDKQLLKEKEIEEGEYFYYTTDGADGFETVFMGKVNSFFVSADSEMVFMEHVSLKKSLSLDSNNTESADENGTYLLIGSSDGTELEEGDIAIIRYGVPESFSSIKVLMNDVVIDTRYNVDAGTYSTGSDELSAGEYEFSLVGVSDELERTLVSKNIIIDASLADSLSSSAKGFAESAGNALNGSNGSGSTIPGLSDSTVIIVLLCVILILIIAPRKK